MTDIWRFKAILWIFLKCALNMDIFCGFDWLKVLNYQANIAWFTSTREKLWIEGNYSTLMNKWYNEKLLLNSLCYFSWWKPFSITFFESSQVTPRPLSSFTYELSIVKYEKVFRLLLYDFVCRLNQTELNVKSWSHKFRESYPILSDLI